jgi:hypothetical protein
MADIENKEQEIFEKWLSPSMKEKAPVELPHKIMATIAMERRYSRGLSLTKREYAVPAGIVAVLALLAVVSLFAASDSGWLLPVAERITKLQNDISLQSLDHEFIKDVKIPSTVAYIAAAMFFLVFFDSALGRFFRRKAY